MKLTKILYKNLIYLRFLHMKYKVKASDSKIIRMQIKLDKEYKYNTKLSQITLYIIEKYKNIS
jgi:hypothetical protein|nr:hypothetical protein [uncultured Romboutsia sp.]